MTVRIASDLSRFSSPSHYLVPVTSNSFHLRNCGTFIISLQQQLPQVVQIAERLLGLQIRDSTVFVEAQKVVGNMGNASDLQGELYCRLHHHHHLHQPEPRGLQRLTEDGINFCTIRLLKREEGELHCTCYCVM